MRNSQPSEILLESPPLGFSVTHCYVKRPKTRWLHTRDSGYPQGREGRPGSARAPSALWWCPETTGIWAPLAAVTTLLFTHGASNLCCDLGAQAGCPQKPGGVPPGSRSMGLVLPAAQPWVPTEQVRAELQVC